MAGKRHERILMSVKYFLPIFLVVYFGAGFVWRSYTVWKKTGINPAILKGSGDAADFIGRLFKLLFGVVVVVIVLYSFFPIAYQYLTPVPWLERAWIRATGVAFLLISLAWIILAQSQMQQSWRIGIDTAHKTELVQRGVFGISRNPIFLGVMMTLLGLLLVAPNAVTLTILAVGLVLINIQVRLEEEHLKRMIGDEYLHYSQRVRRWI